MEKAKNIIIIIIAFMVWSLLCVAFGRYYYPKKEIKVVKEVKYETKWKEAIPTTFNQETFNRLLFCATADIDFKYKIENSSIFVTAFDACKENTVQYEIGTAGNFKVYFGLATLCLVGGAVAYHYLH